jgi:hypothetical protein
VKRIYYSSGSVLTGDYIADAILDLAQVVASRNSTASVDIPVILPDGETGHAKLLISHASPMLAVPEAVMTRISRTWDEDAANDAVRGVRDHIKSLARGGRALPERSPDVSAYIPDFGGL